MSAVVRVINSLKSSLKKNSHQIKITTGLAVFGFLTSVAIAIPLDKVQYNIVMTSDGYPIVWAKNSGKDVDIYGFKKELSAAELQNLEYCDAGAGCSQEAVDKGASHYLIQNVAGRGQVIAYYDANGKLIATQKAGVGAPTALPVPSDSPVLASTGSDNLITADSTADPVGYLEAEFAVSDSGAATYNVPIAIPAGTAGVQPNISLAYSSQSGEGIAGLGWSMSGLSAISRCPKNKTQDGVIEGIQFDSTDQYCIDGQRLIPITAKSGDILATYRTEIDGYNEIIAYDTNGDNNPNHFKVFTQGGEIHSYGTTTDSKISRVFSTTENLPSTSNVVFSWAIKQTKDRKDNYFDYVYNKDFGDSTALEHHISQIRYTGNLTTGLTPYQTINFEYNKVKEQQTSGYFAESNIKKTHLLSGIIIRHGSEQIREYKLGYYEPNNVLNELYEVSKQDKLRSIQECGESSDTCLPATYFKWDGTYKASNTTAGFAAKGFKSKIYDPTPEDLLGKQLGSKVFTSSLASTNFKRTGAERTPNNKAGAPIPFAYHKDRSNKFIGDVNGDGISDIIGINWEANQREAGQVCYEGENDSGCYTVWTQEKWTRKAQVGLGVGDGTFDMTSFDASNVHAEVSTSGRAVTYHPSRLADVNGDGLVDLIHFTFHDVYVNLSDGEKFLPSTTPWLINDFGWSKGWQEGINIRLVQDVNGDGKADLIGTSAGQVFVYLSTGSSFSTIENWSKDWGSTRLVSDFSAEENALELIDVSGDGLPDLVVHSLYGTQVFINNVNNKTFDFIPANQSDYPDVYPYNTGVYTASLLHPLDGYFGFIYYSRGGRDHQRIMGDVNGDGYPDIVGFFRSYTWDVPSQSFTDKNGTYIAYGTGKGFKPYEKISDQWGTRNSEHYPSQLIDVNADGKADLVNFGEDGTYVQLSNGSGFGAKEIWTLEFGRTTGQKWVSRDDMRTFGDFNGDGLIDAIGINTTGVHLGINQTRSLRITGITSGGILPDDSEDNGVNRSIEINYDKLTSNTSTYTKQNNATGDQIDIQPAMFVVSSHYSSNGDISYNITSGSTNTSKEHTAGLVYTYEGLKVDKKRGSLGFQKRTVRDLITNIVTTREYYQTFPYIGQTKSEITELIEETSRKTVSTKLSEFDKVTHTTSAALGSRNYYSVYAPSSTESAFKLTGEEYKNIITTSPPPISCGNFDWTNTVTINPITGKSYGKRTVNEYPPSGDCFARSRLISSEVTPSKNNVASDSDARTSSFTYYSSGQIHTEIVEPGDALSSTTSYVYDDFGNVTQKSIAGSDVTTRTVNTEYKLGDNYYSRFPTKITNAINHTETRTYDYKQGLLASVTGPNGLKSETYSNQFGQKYLTVAPNKTWVHTSYDWCNVPMTAENNESRYCTTTTTSEGGFSKTYYDQIDRVVRSETKGLNGEVIYSDKIYNLANGQLVKDSHPYYNGETPKWVSYTYDELERTKNVTQPDASVSTVTYDGLTTTVTDGKGNVKIETNDIQGKPKLVEDALGNTVEYIYFVNGNLDKTINTASTIGGQITADVAISTTSFSYDKLGNKEGMVDPDMGTWAYKYNAFGELTKQTDAEGQVVDMVYDELGRLTKRTEPEGVTTWTYDTAVGKGEGKLHTVTSPSGYKKTLSYNNFGQLAIIEEQIPNSVNGVSDGTATYFTQNTYDAHGRLDTVAYPKTNPLKPVVVQYIYNAHGNLTSIQNAATNDPYWTANIADAKGNLKEQTLGNGVISNRTYDTLGRLETIVSKKGSTALQDLGYKFDVVGNLNMRENHISHVKEDFGYDNIYRLISSATDVTNTASFSNTGGALYGFAMPMSLVTTGGVHPYVANKSFSYDGHGNIMTKQGKNYEYLGGRTHAVSKVGNKTFTYDANGNMYGSYEGNNSRTITWTSFNKPEEITKTKNSKETLVRLAYDDGHSRILKQSTHTDTSKIAKNTWYIAGGLVEREETASGANKGAEVYKFTLKAGGQTVGYINQFKSKEGLWTTEKTRYLLTDHLGSTDVVTNEVGGVVMRTNFDAWGKRQESFAVQTELDLMNTSFAEEVYKIGFTGHEHDDEVGLINMKGRMYDAEIGRFISADPIVQAATDTQSYSRYSYVRNNPLSLTDPSGYSWLSKLWKGVKRFWKKWGRTILAIAVTIYTGGLAAGFLGGGAFGTFAGLANLTLGKAIIAGAIGGFFGGAISTGSLRGAIRGAVFGGLSAGLANGIGHGFGGGGIGDPGTITRAVAHGVAQGTVSVLRGGKFGAGFISSFASSVGSRFIKGGGVLMKAAKHAVLGGTVSKLVGGKFANGAVTAAFTYLFNDAVETSKEMYNRRVREANERQAVINSGPLGQAWDYVKRSVGKTIKGFTDFWIDGSKNVSPVTKVALGTVAATKTYQVIGALLRSDTALLVGVKYSREGQIATEMIGSGFSGAAPVASAAGGAGYAVCRVANCDGLVK